MKKGILTSIIVFSGISLFSQNLSFGIQKTHAHSIKKEVVNEAKKMSDLIPMYPSEWISKYVSVELVYRKEGEALTLASKNEVLSTEQKNILKTADIGDDITINIKYLSKNAVNGKEEVCNMHYETGIVPEVEAEFEITSNNNAQHDKKDGRTAQYVKNNIINKIPEATQKQIKLARVRFTVSEDGQVTALKIHQSCGDIAIDKLIVNALANMPKWKPAQIANGTKVKQQFEFRLGILEGC